MNKLEAVLYVQQSKENLLYLPIDFRDDKNIVISAIHAYADTFGYASLNMRSNREVALLAVTKYGQNTQFLSQELKNDKKIAKAAIEQNGLGFSFLSDKIKGNKTLALLAIEKNFWTLEYVSNKLKNDKELIWLAFNQSYLKHGNDPVLLENINTSLKKFVGKELMDEIGDNDILQYINSTMLKEKLETITEFKLDTKKITKMKI